MDARNKDRSRGKRRSPPALARDPFWRPADLTSGALRLYLAEIGRIPLLDARDERRLAARIARARCRLIAALAGSRESCNELRRLCQEPSRAPDDPPAGHGTLDRGRADAPRLFDELDRLLHRFPRGGGADASVRRAALRCRIRIGRTLLALGPSWPQLERLAQDRIRTAEAGRTGRLPRVVKQVRTSLHRLRKAKDQLVRSNLRLVVHVARPHAGRGLPLLDLIQEGNLGLIKAADEFDGARGFRFSTYATWWIRRAVLRAMIDAHAVRLPLHVLELVSRAVRVRARLAQELAAEPSDEQLAERLRLAPGRISATLYLSQPPISIDQPLGGEDALIRDLIEDRFSASALERVEADEARKLLRLALARLSPREARILRLRFGLEGLDEQTAAEVGRRMSLSSKRIRQIQSTALKRLQRSIEDGRGRS